MRKLTILFFSLFSLLISGQNSSDTETFSLNNGWQFTQINQNKWIQAEVPGSVQHDLIRHQILPNPYYGTNEKLVQWPENEDWDFKKTFSVTAEQLRFDDAYIYFEGLDTHADVFLNGSRILQSQNMFVGHKVSVKNALRAGENELYIRFYSPITHLMPAHLTNGFDYPAGNDHSDVKMSVYNRKAPYQFDWDWGMRLVQMGIWRPVSLTFYNRVRIEDFFVKQVSITEQFAEINNEIEVFSTDSQPVQAQITVQYTLTSTTHTNSVTQNVLLQQGVNRISIPLTISNPKRWMPIHWGKQHLYNFTASVRINDKNIAQETKTIGLRTIKLVQQKDEHGTSFYFEVNGIPFFAKGANYIQGEIMRSRQDKAYNERFFDNVVAANMNMVRIWGGGTYEDDYFYQLADEKGILIWQDFIFACVPYPSDDTFLSNVKEEVVYNIKRLRNRASLAFWCGNNEIEEALKYWGWQKTYSAEIYEKWMRGYNKTFRQLIPELVEKYDGTRSYIHGSPYHSNWGRTETFQLSDVHDWGLWHGRMPFEALLERIPRFASEFGFQSFPEMKTIRTFAEEKDFDIDSDVMKTHQKSGIGNQTIKQYMDRYYHTPKNFEDFVYINLAMQGNGMKKVVEAYRRNRPYCMGALYWQINDDWPAVSWSSIDYYNNWKSQHYKMRDVFAPIALSAEMRDNQLRYFTMSDLLHDTDNLRLKIEIIHFNGEILHTSEEKVSAKANTSQWIKTLPLSDLLSEPQKHEVVVHARLSDGDNNTISTKDYFFYWPNQLHLPEPKINTSVIYADGKYTVTLTSSKLAKDVFIEIPVLGAKFTDNFFDLMRGKEKVIEITSPQLKASPQTAIKVKHIRETY